MNIFAVAVNLHDHNTYDGSFHNQVERYTRVKHNMMNLNSNDYTLADKFLKKYCVKNKDCVVAFSYTHGAYRNENAKHHLLNLLHNPSNYDNSYADNEHAKLRMIRQYNPTHLFEHYYVDDVYYVDHHQAHAAYALLSSRYQESDILAIDGIGSKFKCIFVDKNYNIINLSDKLPLGSLWNISSTQLGFGNLGAGKLMGLVGYGSYNEYYYNILEMLIEEMSNLKDPEPQHIKNLYEKMNVEKYGKEDLAFTLQQFTIDKIEEFVIPLKTSKNICIAGGVAYNGYMNEFLTKHYDNVYVPPAPGDEGQALGVYMHADYVLNDNIHIPELYSGADHDVDETTFSEKLDIDNIAQEIANGKIVGWYQGKSESGYRALGNRSILADPRNPDIKNIINSTIKKREDFRPFAPSVLEDHYKEYFNTNQPSPYMSRIVPVISNKIPGVTHVDGTARIQTVTREQNAKFYDLISAFYKITGIPMLLNTSFNCQEPIVETPEDAVSTFNKTGLDILVVNDWVMRK